MKMWEGIIVLGVILLMIILSPIWIPFLAYVYITEKIDEYRFTKYLATAEGAKYFCYTNKQNSQKYVENNILPFLPGSIEVVHVSSKRLINLGKNHKFPDRIVGKMKAMKKGFPCIAKISGGKLITESINHELHRAIVRKKDADDIVERINRFFV